MIDFIIAGLSAGLFVFCTLFLVSFITLSVLTAMIHGVAVVSRSLLIDKSHPHQQQTV